MLYDYPDECKGKSWGWKQGWLTYFKDPWNYNNPHQEGSQKSKDFWHGWDRADFLCKVEGGYYDW